MVFDTDGDVMSEQVTWAEFVTAVFNITLSGIGGLPSMADLISIDDKLGTLAVHFDDDFYGDPPDVRVLSVGRIRAEQRRLPELMRRDDTPLAKFGACVRAATCALAASSMVIFFASLL